jgi:thiosulfate/3-mercaptopyruvate sulfurtransferase
LVFNYLAMSYKTLITAAELQHLQATGSPLMVFDCSADLMRPEQGERQYQSEHIAGAVFADLNAVLSTHVPGAGQSGGRHPLPAREDLAQWLQSRGFEAGMQAVVYDRNGCNFCVRLWWLFKWLGHESVAVLDGGLAAWKQSGSACESGSSTMSDTAEPKQASTGANTTTKNTLTESLAKGFRLAEPLVTLMNAQQVQARLGQTTQTLVDARAAPRYRGETEPLDPVAGHIPGALNRPFAQNFEADGRFKSPERLRQEWQSLLAGRHAGSIVNYCGSGVSATPNVLALQLAGFGASALYAGSWSDWCSDVTRPVAQSA